MVPHAENAEPLMQRLHVPVSAQPFNYTLIAFRIAIASWLASYTLQPDTVRND